jgi:N-terminal domain of galactosyltransferase
MDNFDLSIVMPFYKKLEEFKYTLPKNAVYFERNGIEVIIVVDENESVDELIHLVNQYPFINWRIIKNDTYHDWRNPTKTINVGIRHSEKKYILVVGPDSEMYGDLIYQLRYYATHHENSFFVGRVAFCDYTYEVNDDTVQNLPFLYYGSILAKREFFEQVRGYDESFNAWGGDDDNIRARLNLIGLRKMRVEEAMLIHREKVFDGHFDRLKKSRNLPLLHIKTSYYPNCEIVNEDNWGRDFDKKVYEWRKNKYAEANCMNYLRKFKNYEIFNKDIFTKKYKIIALIPVYNEIAHIPEVLQHLDKYCDGIILLDDSSTDGTYEEAKSQKLLLKIQKHRDCFNDLDNRNILLNIASFFTCEWYFFSDADERFDARFSDLYSITKDDSAHTICFYLVHLWDKTDFFRVDIPEKSPFKQGIVHRWRMFRNIGRMNITYIQKLHMPATPYKKGRYIAPILIKHYGMLDAKKRHEKYLNYHKEDESLSINLTKYDYFIDSDVQLENVKNINDVPKIFFVK